MLKIKITILSFLLSVISLNANATLTEAIDAYALKEYQTAYELFLPLAEAGNQYAQYGLAKMYENGQQSKNGDEDGKVDNANAFKWYQKAANQEYGIAQNNLGLMLEKGIGTERNVEQAEKWYQRSCDNRCSHGCKNLQRLVFEE